MDSTINNAPRSVVLYTANARVPTCTRRDLHEEAKGGSEGGWIAEDETRSVRGRACTYGRTRVFAWTRGLLSKVSEAPVGAGLGSEGGRRSPRDRGGRKTVGEEDRSSSG